MKVILERSPTRRGGSLSVWGSCFASAEELLFVETLDDFFCLRSFPAGFWLWEKGEKGGREHMDQYCLNGWTLIW